jgi:hypothetical protein
MATFQLIELATGDEVIQRVNDDGTIDSIPKDLGNKDYLAYLESLEA